ncbi:MAG: hypothetical protein LLG09_02535 [Negativicutes bacterium]|nr:hypothetical protein [Negativicutes bacterium]
MLHRIKTGRRKGITLVEMVVTSVLLLMFLTSITSLIGPYINSFYRVQDLNNCQLMAETILESVRSQLREATKINLIINSQYKGQLILYTDPEGVYRLLETGGGIKSVYDMNGIQVGADTELQPGELWICYYRDLPDLANDPGAADRTRGIEQVYGEEFYAGSQIALTYQPVTFNDGEKTRISYVTVTIEVWRGDRLIFSDKGVIDLQYKPISIIG